MSTDAIRTFTTPREGDLGLRQITSATGLAASLLPNGALFVLEHQSEHARIMLNQVPGSPVHGGIGRLCLRMGGDAPRVIELVGPAAKVRFGAAADRFLWEGATEGITHRVTLWLAPREPIWLWHVEITNTGKGVLPCDAVLIQDLGLGDRGFVQNNEAYVSQYIDHHVEKAPDIGPVIMSRQNLSQGGRFPWVVQGCLDGAVHFATDALQLFGPGYRDLGGLDLPFGTDLPSLRLQHEVACAALQSRPASVKPGALASWTFFGLHEPDHPAASGESDLALLVRVKAARAQFAPADVTLAAPRRSLLQDSPPLLADRIGDAEIARLYGERRHEERRDGTLLSFFVPDGAQNRHIVLRSKEHLVPRRHGTLIRSGQGMLLDDTTLCATCWMTGVFGAQLTIGNTSFHKLFSISRDPYNITRASGLRILADLGEGWWLLAVPSVFEIGLSDCRWIYRSAGRTITVETIASGDDSALQWQVTVEGKPCRFLVFGHLVMGERELNHQGRIEVDTQRKRISFTPDKEFLWGQRYPESQYLLVTGSPEAVEAVGGDELLYEDGTARNGAYVALRTRAVGAFRFAVVGSLTDRGEALRLADKYAGNVASEAMLAPARRYWTHLTRGLRIESDDPGAQALDTMFPWLAHNAMIHLSVPHGLEQYTGAAWGTRDVCQGPVEYLLSLDHDAPVKEILRIVFAQQYEKRGDWPQWFMLEPYSDIQDKHAHGDVIVWPLKALCDYVEWTNDFSFLDEEVAWRNEDTLAATSRKDSVAKHIEKLLATAAGMFIPGTKLIRYGEGDWNDSLQPADPRLRDHMVSSWTVALLFQQVKRYSQVLRQAGRLPEAESLRRLALEMRRDFNQHLIRDGTVAGYAIFEPGQEKPELLLHPSDERTGLKYSLLPMKRGIISGMFDEDQTQHHLKLIRQHLLHPDGARLMDKPVTYRGGPERIFRRAESAANFGREIGLMYTHAHLRFAEAMSLLDDADALWDALLKVNPIAVTELLGHASLRQRNTYFSSSDAAFPDRYAASAQWARVKKGEVAVDGGWRIYSSGPGLYTNVLVRLAFGRRRHFGERIDAPLLPKRLKGTKLTLADEA
ncbi:GH36-type glycosyl hydrolase domain-containing protein [Taklimakanibacter lacteus]|uniref:GH36-type glycosyl hydrolase domain-containing protein n=1 Tax=Taklimakanibacter lacteus TaxID=2268456 RepID=UPI000E66E239